MAFAIEVADAEWKLESWRAMGDGHCDCRIVRGALAYENSLMASCNWRDLDVTRLSRMLLDLDRSFDFPEGSEPLVQAGPCKADKAEYQQFLK